MNVLIIKNTPSEGPGTIGDYLIEQGMKYIVLEFSGCGAIDELPDLRPYTHLVIMGGPMAVYESEGLPFLHLETAIIRVFIKTGRPVLGVCLGAQIIANALWARVYKGPVQETGWEKVEITGEGMQDAVFSSLAVGNQSYADIFQWHGDTFDLPEKATRLASSAHYENQAFRYGNNVYGLQFHIEVTPAIIEEWFRKEEGFDVTGMLDTAREIFPEYKKRAFRFYDNFFI
ncbi:MAG: type 1 glutamine amidotransferase [Nitrospirota bacterium]